jgi:hypothetical protein
MLALAPPRTARPQKLGEQPSGEVYLTVVRTFAGCATPAVLRSK